MARIAGFVFGTLLILGMMILLVEEGVSMFRGWRNVDGASVPGYGLYERHFSSPVTQEELDKNLPPELRGQSRNEWELTEFYQWEMQCRILAANSQRAWAKQRDRLLARPGFWADGRPIFTDADLPVEKYQCVPTNMLYRAGMGWGLF